MGGLVFRELRPVSFSFRQGSDAKQMLYQDLIALVTLAAQDHQSRLERNHGEVSKLRDMVKRLAVTLGRLNERMAGLLTTASGSTGVAAGPAMATVADAMSLSSSPPAPAPK